jgi:hypothetical protein
VLVLPKRGIYLNTFEIASGGVICRVSQEEWSIFWDIIVLVVLSRKAYIYMCHIPNGYRERRISLYNSKSVDKKNTLHAIYNTSIYCSSEKVDSVFLV